MWSPLHLKMTDITEPITETQRNPSPKVHCDCPLITLTLHHFHCQLKYLNSLLFNYNFAFATNEICVLSQPNIIYWLKTSGQRLKWQITFSESEPEIINENKP